MTPEERQLVDDLFDRLARLESSPRDAEAESAITEGLRRAPHALYALVQTTLVQDEALKRADARIRELTGEDATPPVGGFLESMRNAFAGRTSVPSVRPTTDQPDPRWNSGSALPPASAPSYGSPFQSGGGSFLGTAAASAAGVIGGALLLNSISSMFGHHGGSAFAAVPPSNSPWDNSSANSDLAREAGVNDVGSGPVGNSAGLFDAGDDNDFDGDTSDDFGGDFGDDSA